MFLNKWVTDANSVIKKKNSQSVISLCSCIGDDFYFYYLFLRTFSKILFATEYTYEHTIYDFLWKKRRHVYLAY